MIQPPPALANALVDSCPTCGQSLAPIVVDGTADNPNAGYHDTNGHVWFVEWQRSYTKATNEPVLLNVGTVPAPIPSANPNTTLNYSGPTCKGCGSVLGQGHASNCPYVGG